MKKKAYAVRVETDVMLEIVKKYGSFTAFVKEKIKRDRKIKRPKEEK
ncbi:MAG: hypothetical protein KJO73_09115 [Croceitalea sp.]|nr:hypothetical protein [Croceitalea sp.]